MINTKYPTIKPSLNLDFANTKSLDPRITFRRGTPGTYYDGVTHVKAEENLIDFSEDFSQWGYGRIVQTSGQSAPDGSSTAYKIEQESGQTNSGYLLQTYNTSANKSYTFSVYAKAGTNRNYVILRTYLSNNRFAYFDLANGVIDNVDERHSASISDAGNGWYRCSITYTPISSSSVQFNVYFSDNDSSLTVADDGGFIYLWGAQLEQRDAVASYTATNGAPITKYQPKLMTAPADSARFDHDPITGESKGLLIEEQRTNLIAYSEDFLLDGWFKHQNDSNFKYLFVEEASTVSPGGEVDASKVYTTQEMPNTGAGFIEAEFSLTDNTIYTASVYAKKAEYKMLSFQFHTKDSLYSSVFVDLNDGIISSSTAVIDNSIEHVGNGWYRVRFSFNSQSGGTTPRIILQVRNDNGVADLETNKGIYIWGAQLEAGSFPTSYVKTTGASATRSADNASITGENFSSWYRQDEGSIYLNSEVHESRTASTYKILSFYKDSSNWIDIASTGRELTSFLYTNGSNQAQLYNQFKSQTPYTINSSVGYKKDSASLFNKGEQVMSDDTSAEIPSGLDKLFIGNRNNSFWTGKLYIKKLAYYPQRLTNEQLQNLTK